MAKSSWNHALVWVSLAGALTGCSTVPDSPHTAGTLPGALDIAGDNEPVPQVEPASRSGNPDTYVVFGRRYRVKETSAGYREQGTASWYGWEFHGRKTSSGPPFNMFELTAAHKSLPLPTYVRVTNLDNGRSTVVKVTDRGPFVGTRLIDLSYAAAARLDMLDQGTASVEVVALAPYQSLPALAARRAEKQELLASRAARARMREAARIEFAHAAPIRPSAQAPGRPPAQVLASLERKPPPVRLALAGGERDSTPVKPSVRVMDKPSIKVLAKPAVRVAEKPPMRLALASVRNQALNKPLIQRADLPPVRLALADVERSAPKKAVAKAASVKPAKVEDTPSPGRASLRPAAPAPTAKGRDGTAKLPVPAPSANRNGKPVPARQASESKPTTVRLASLKLNRPRGVAD